MRGRGSTLTFLGLWLKFSRHVGLGRAWDRFELGISLVKNSPYACVGLWGENPTLLVLGAHFFEWLLKGEL